MARSTGQQQLHCSDCTQHMLGRQQAAHASSTQIAGINVAEGLLFAFGVNAD